MKLNRLEALFQQRKQPVLNVYCTAGFPDPDSTLKVMEALQEGGADIIELGMPYSDPLADGPVIQASSSRALQNGMNLHVLFEQLKNFRERIRIPVILMGYLNPILQFGFEKFCASAAAVGVDGLIIPDIPMYEFETEYRDTLVQNGLCFSFLVTPETNDERVKKLDALSSGFLYAVSSSSITGSDKDFSDVDAYLRRLQNMKLKNPVLVGFGIRDHQSFQAASKYSSGAIVGTAYIQAIEKADDIVVSTRNFVQSIKGA